MAVQPRCPKCSNQWLLTDMDGPACPVCGWRPTRAPTKLERTRAHPSLHLPRESKSRKRQASPDDPWDSIPPALSIGEVDPRPAVQ